MDFIYWIVCIYEHKVSIGIQCMLALLTYLLMKYRYRKTSFYLNLSRSTQERLIAMFEPLPIASAEEPYKFDHVRCNFSSFDVFNLSNRFKNEIKSVICEYGVGTCGPRGFYGTLDLHLELEAKLSSLFGKEAAILYPNYFNCIQSVIFCFCKARNHVFIHKDSAEAILRGIHLSRSKVVTFETIDDLGSKLEKSLTDKYVVVEKVGKNTGRILDLRALVELKKEHRFRIILDEGHSIPFMYQAPQEKELYADVDIITGALCLGYPSNGGYSIGCNTAIEYQQLSGSSYVFSASLPAFLVKATICMLNATLDYTKIRRKIGIALRCIEGVVSDPDLPMLLVETKDPHAKQRILRDAGYVVGIHGSYLRLCINEDCDDGDLRRMGDLLK